MAPAKNITDVMLTKSEDWLAWISFVPRNAVRECGTTLTPTQKKRIRRRRSRLLNRRSMTKNGSPVKNPTKLIDAYKITVATFIARYETFREKIENLDYMDELIERTTTTRMKTYTSSSTNVHQTPQLLKKHLRTDNAITTMKECGGCGSRFHAWQGCKLIEKAPKPRTHSGLLVYETKERIEKWLDKGQNRHLALRNLDKEITKTDENTTDKLSVSKMEGRIDGGCNATTNFAPRPGMFRKASSLARAQIRTSATI